MKKLCLTATEAKPDLVNLANLVASMEASSLKYSLAEIVYNLIHSKIILSKPKKKKKNNSKETLSETSDSSGSSN